MHTPTSDKLHRFVRGASWRAMLAAVGLYAGYDLSHMIGNVEALFPQAATVTQPQPRTHALLQPSKYQFVVFDYNARWVDHLGKLEEPRPIAAANLKWRAPFFKKIAETVGIDVRLLYALSNIETRHWLIPVGQTTTSAKGEFQTIDDVDKDARRIISNTPRYLGLWRELTPPLARYEKHPDRRGNKVAQEADRALEKESFESTAHAIIDRPHETFITAIQLKHFIEARLIAAHREPNFTNMIIGFSVGPECVVAVLDERDRSPLTPMADIPGGKNIRNNGLDPAMPVGAFYQLYDETSRDYQKAADVFLARGRVEFPKGVRERAPRVVAAFNAAQHAKVPPRPVANAAAVTRPSPGNDLAVR